MAKISGIAEMTSLQGIAGMTGMTGMAVRTRMAGNHRSMRSDKMAEQGSEITECFK
jgi:hypothetical protein